MSEQPAPNELPPPYDITEPKTKQNGEMTFEKLVNHKLFKSIYRQFELYRQLYQEADENTQALLMKRFKEVFVVDEVIEKISSDKKFDETLFANYLLEDNQFALNELSSVLPGGPEQVDGKAGILVYEIKQRTNGSKKLIMHLPAYEGKDLLTDLRDSFSQLATLLKEDEEIEQVEGYSVLIGKKSFQKRFLPKEAEFAEAHNIPDNEEGLSGSQGASLLFNRSDLKRFLTTGQKPKSIGVKIDRETFLRTYLTE